MGTDELKVNDRLDMLKHLSFIGGDNAVNVFSSYIPDHYNEIYTLYKLLEVAGIDYNDIDFNKPQENGNGVFVFLCVFKKPSDISSLSAFLKNNDSKVKYKRNTQFSISIKEYPRYTSIRFTRV